MKKALLLTVCCCLCVPLNILAEDFIVPSAIPAAGGVMVPVVIAEDRQAVVAYEPRTEAVQALVNAGICKLSGKTNLAEAWRTYVSTQDIIGIKVLSSPGASSGTRPAVVEAVIHGLLDAGMPSRNIVIWDKHIADLKTAGYVDMASRLNVQAAGSAEAGYDENVFYENSILGTLVWGDLEFGRKDAKSGRKSYISKLLTTRITKIINIAPLLNHNVAGVNGCLSSLSLGSVDNTARFESQPDRLARAVPEIYAQAPLVDHTVLSIMDALIGQYQGEQLSLLHYATPLGQIWFSKDPVALDTLAIVELERERQVAGVPLAKPNPELYQNATLMELGASDLRKIRVMTLQ